MSSSGVAGRPARRTRRPRSGLAGRPRSRRGPRPRRPNRWPRQRNAAAACRRSHDRQVALVLAHDGGQDLGRKRPGTRRRTLPRIAVGRLDQVRDLVDQRGLALDVDRAAGLGGEPLAACATICVAPLGRVGLDAVDPEQVQVAGRRRRARPAGCGGGAVHARRTGRRPASTPRPGRPGRRAARPASGSAG